MRTSARALVPALVVLALLGVVAVAATGSTTRGSDRTRPPAAMLLDTILTLGLVGVVAGGLLFAYGLTKRKEIGQEIATGRYPRTSIVAWGVFAITFTALSYWRLNDWVLRVRPLAGEESDPLFPEGTPRPGDTRPETPGSTYEPEIAWIPIIVVLVLVAVVVAAYVLSERRARRGGLERDELLERVSRVLDETLDDVRAEPDPRRAIIAAYARLEHVLAANGVPPRPAETQEEYLHRFLLSVEVSERAARLLTDLFERAKFSQHAVDARMKEDAIDALERLRTELRRGQEAHDEVVPPTIATGRSAS